MTKLSIKVAILLTALVLACPITVVASKKAATTKEKFRDCACQNEKTYGIGAGTNFSPRALDAIRSSKIDWLRKELIWSKVEKQPGQYDWTDFDAFVDAAKSRGYKVMAVLIDTPSWAVRDKTLANSPDAHKQIPTPEYWRRFVTAAVTHYRNRVDAWEVGNKPNVPFFFSGSLDDYREVILKEASSAIQKIDGKAIIVAPGLTTRKAADAATLAELFEPVFAKGGAKATDVVSIHVYGTPKEIISAGAQAREFMRSAGIGDKKLWLTEFGWNTSNITEQVQKNNMLKLQALNQQQGAFQKMFYCRLIDGGKTMTGNPDKHGILREDLSPKPIKSAF